MGDTRFPSSIAAESRMDVALLTAVMNALLLVSLIGFDK